MEVRGQPMGGGSLAGASRGELVRQGASGAFRDVRMAGSPLLCSWAAQVLVSPSVTPQSGIADTAGEPEEGKWKREVVLC